MNSNARPTTVAARSDDLAWRVIGLLNVFRLLVPMVLILLLFFNAPNNSVGAVKPGLFLGICVAYFTFGLVCVQPIQRRWPGAEWMALFPLTVDGVAITLLVHASGGVSSGLATLLFLPVGAIAAIVRPRLALLATAVISIGLLLETLVSTLTGVTPGSDFLAAGLTGASLFAITLLAIPLANRLRESEALVQQRDRDRVGDAVGEGDLPQRRRAEALAQHEDQPGCEVQHAGGEEQGGVLAAHRRLRLRDPADREQGGRDQQPIEVQQADHAPCEVARGSRVARGTGHGRG